MSKYVWKQGSDFSKDSKITKMRLQLSNYALVVALDFGATYSGYALSFKSDFETDQQKIFCNNAWYNGFRSSYSFKTPTCVLLDKNKGLKTFGYDAENSFAALRLADKEEYYFFKEFITEKNFNRDMMLIDATGKSLPACQVFETFIKAFVNHMKEFLVEVKPDFTKGVVIWVIPVPAYLTDTGKQFLRSCAQQAGITSDQLMFVKETEAAFIYCHQLIDRYHRQKCKDGTEYMVVHLGGCSADITVLKKYDNQVIEKYRVTGNDCGGKAVNNSFLKFLERYFGWSLVNILEKEKPSTFLELKAEFEWAKRSIKSNQMNITLAIPYSDMDLYCKKYKLGDLPSVIFKFPNLLSLTGYKMDIKRDMVQSFFEETITNIVCLMEKVFTDYENAHKVTGIVMIGGFSECSLIQDAVREKFCNKNIIIPEDAELAVMKGAVLCGHQTCNNMQILSSEIKSQDCSSKTLSTDNQSWAELLETQCEGIAGMRIQSAPVFDNEEKQLVGAAGVEKHLGQKQSGVSL